MLLIFIIISLILVVPSTFLVVYGIRQLIKRVASNKKNGVKVIGTIKNVQKIKIRDDRRDAVYDTHIELECEYEYEGKIHNSILKVYNVFDEGKYKVGDKIECIYNTETNGLADELNLKVKDNLNWYIALVSGVLMGLFAIIYAITDNTVIQVITLIIGVVFWYATVILFFDPFYAKEKGKYIKLKGHVVDYYVRYRLDETSHSYYYHPEVLFKYNNEKRRYISSRSSYKKLYNIGQEVNVLYYPEKDIIYEKGNNGLAYFFMIVPIVIGIVMLIQYLLR